MWLEWLTKGLRMAGLRTEIWTQDLECVTGMLPWIFISPYVLFDWVLINLKKTGVFVCNADLTLRRARITIAASQMREVWNILSVLVCFCLSYQALRAHAPYCRLWPYHIFPHIMNGTIFVKKKCHWTQNVSIFTTTFFMKHFSF